MKLKLVFSNCEEIEINQEDIDYIKVIDDNNMLCYYNQLTESLILKEENNKLKEIDLFIVILKNSANKEYYPFETLDKDFVFDRILRFSDLERFEIIEDNNIIMEYYVKQYLVDDFNEVNNLLQTSYITIDKGLILSVVGKEFEL